MKSKFDSDPESESEDERRTSKRRSPPSSSSLGHARGGGGGGGGYSGYHDTVMSEEEHSENELAHEQPEEGEENEEGQADKESMFCYRFQYAIHPIAILTINFRKIGGERIVTQLS